MILRVHQFDWSSTSLGDKELWSKSFRAAVNLCLHSMTPTLIVGGEEMIQLYNSAFATLIGSRHPEALGMRGEDFWEDHWNELGPIVKRVREQGEAILQENQRMILIRRGQLGENYFTISYTPIFDGDSVQGIFVSVTETTHLIRKDQHLKYLRNQLVGNHLAHAPLALCLLQGEDMVIEIANHAMLELWDRTSEQVLNRPVFEALPQVQHQGFGSFAQEVFNTGEKIVLPEAKVVLNRKDSLETLYVRMVIEAVREGDNSISGVMVLAEEITEEVLSRKQIEESELRHKLAIEAAAMGTFEWNMVTGRFDLSNRLAEIFGYPDNVGVYHNELIARIHPDDIPIRAEAHKRAIITGVLFYEVRVVWPDDSIHWVRLNGKIIYDEAGAPSTMYGTTLDITDQRMATRRLEEQVKQRTLVLQQRNTELKISEERYHKMIEGVEDYAIILLDLEGYIQNWNKGAEHIKGYKENEIIGKNFKIFYTPEDQQRRLPEQLIDLALKKGRAMNEGWRVRKDGSTFWSSVIITTLHGDDNTVIGFTKVTRDLTERRVAEDQMLAYTAELEAKNKELEQFAYIASHDLQEPLRKIRTFSELIQQNLNDGLTTRRYFDKINASAHRMSELIKSVLAYSKISKDSDLIEEVDLNPVLRNVLTDYELLIEEKQATIIHEILPVVTGVSAQLGQLFSNLISNSLKFTNTNPVIRISSRKLSVDEITGHGLMSSNPYIELSFTDNGIGFDQHYEKKIFTMFQRLNRKEQYAGTGIGLAVCKKIVENHHGSISAQSQLGKGTTFLVILPSIAQ